MRYIVLSFLFLPASLLAETIQIPATPITIEPSTDRDFPAASVQTHSQSDIQTASKSSSIHFSEQDLLNNTALTEMLLNQAILERNKDFLADLLTVYQHSSHPDPILSDYARSTSLYLNGKHHAAMEILENLLKQYPDLEYVRMNLAMLQLENKHYPQATQQFRFILQNTSNDNLRNIAKKNLQSMEKLTAWQFNGHIAYDKNDNVNNASNEKSLIINGITFQKSAESMPQQAEGFNYGAAASRLIPLSGNHNLIFDNHIDGHYYWNNHQYSRHSLYTSGGYSFQNKETTLRISPFFTQSWMDSQRYAHGIGMQYSLNYRFHPNWRIQFGLTDRKTRYRKEEHHDFNNRALSTGTTLIFSHANFLTYTGFNYINKKSLKPSLSSHQWQIKSGTATNWGKSLGISAHFVYGKAQYRQAPDFKVNPYPFNRNDRTWSMTFSAWRPKWNYHGLMPKLNFTHDRTISNMPAFYSTKNQHIYISIEKEF